MSSIWRYTTITSALWTALLVLFPFLICSVAIIVTLATRTATLAMPAYGVAVAASCVSILALAACTVLVVLSSYHKSWRSMLAAWILSASIATVSASFTLYFLVWVWHDLDAAPLFLDPRLTIAGLIACAITVILEIALHILVLFSRQNDNNFLPIHIPRGATPPAKLTKRSLAPTPILIPPSRIGMRAETEPVSSAFSAYSDSVKQSWRSSMIRAMSPSMWKSKLVSSSSLAQDMQDGESPPHDSTEIARDGEVQPTPSTIPVRTARFHKRYAARKLETIPGSRPVSPGNLLEGPFPQVPEHGEVAMLESPRPSYTPDCGIIGSATAIPSDSDKNTTGQSHIHPLFRSKSAAALSRASPGTVIIASPFAGRIVGATHLTLGVKVAQFEVLDAATSLELLSHS